MATAFPKTGHGFSGQPDGIDGLTNRETVA